MKKKIIVVVLIVIGIGILMYLGKPNQSIKENEKESINLPKVSGILSANETVHDFGKISMKDGKVSKIFKVTNSTENDVNLKIVATSCMCTIAYIVDGGSKKGPFGMEGMGNTRTNEIIKAGEFRDIEVVFDPNAHGPAGVGMIDRFVSLVDDSGKSIELEIKAIVTP